MRILCHCWDHEIYVKTVNLLTKPSDLAGLMLHFCILYLFKIFVTHLSENLKVIRDVQTAKQFNIKPGQKICRRSRIPNNKYEEEEIVSEIKNSDDKEYSLPSEQGSEEINNTVGSLIGSPRKSVSSKDKVAYGKRKMKHILNSSSELIASCLAISVEKLVPINSVTDDCQCCQKARDLDRLMAAIKEKFVVSPKSKQLKLIPLSPSSWSTEKVSNSI